MSDSYVCSGATMRCTMGDQTAKLTVLPSRTVFLCGKPLGNISDHQSMVNLAPFGKCRSLGYPATASATAAHHGVLTPMPCVHNTPMPWIPGKADYIVKGQPALLKSCKCQCMWGGMISLIDDGQIGEGTQYVNKSGKTSAEDLLANNNLTPESVLDGIQLALDVAGFVPGFGAVPDLINASISALRGNWSEAGLSVLAAVPLIGDAAAGVKVAKKGVKLAQDSKKIKVAKETVSTVTRVAKCGKGEKIIGKFSAKQVNQWWEIDGAVRRVANDFHPPYKKGTDVLHVKLTENKTFVRVYDGANSGKRGAWVMEKESIEGLTPKQIQNKFALPQEPKYVVDVELPAGTELRKGIANKVKGWGEGGGIQYDLMGVKVDGFKNGRLIP